MIHVCRVDIGDRYVFDMGQGIDDVLSLKHTIERIYNVNINDQVLLISGGEVLNNVKQKLFGLSAGIEESPIYLIDIKNVKQKLGLHLIDHTQTTFDSNDLIKDIDIAINLKASFNTLQSRTQLAAKIYEYDLNLNKLCESFYNDQYWQYQGFLALIANFDESLLAFNKLFESLQQQFEEYSKEKTHFSQTLNDIDTYIKILGKIRLLPQIAQNALANSKLFTSSHQLASPQIVSINTNEQIKTLLDWSNSTDPRHKLDTVIDNAKECILQIDDNWWSNIEKQVNDILIESDNKQYKDIEGLTNRLYDLNVLLNESKSLLNKQAEFRDCFKANCSRANNLRDDSVLRDLCIGHGEQLKNMKENHIKMIEITKKIYKAKCELIRVVHIRLSWVMNIQQKMFGDVQTKVRAYSHQIKQSIRHLKQLEQLKIAPEIYFLSLNETIRRERFSTVYKKFTKDVYEIADTVFKQELTRRERFHEKFCRSFIANLFPYLNDTCVNFIQPELNLNYDTSLPQLDFKEIASLIEESEYEFDKNLVSEDENNLNLVKNLNNTIEKLSKKNEETLAADKTTTTTTEQLIDDGELVKINLNLSESECTNETNDEEQIVLINTKPNANQEFIKKLNDILKQDLSSFKELVSKKYEIQAKLNEFNSEIDSFKKTISSNLVKKVEEKKEFYDSLIDTLFVTNTSDQSIKFNDELDEGFYNRIKDNLLKLRETYEKTLEESRKNNEIFKFNFMAEKQKQFNEAIERVKVEKEKKLEELKLVNANLMNQLESLKPVSQLTTSSKNDENYFKDKIEQLERLVDYYKNQQINGSFYQNSNASQSVDNTLNVSSIASQPLAPIECIKLNSCAVDDLVVVVYDVIHCSYKIINHSSSHIHFVNTDSLKQFDISQSQASNTSQILQSSLSATSNSPSSPLHLFDYFSTLNAASVNEFLRSLIGDACPQLCDNRNLNLVNNRPLWFVARVTDREFCIARKDSNRFKLPIGTRFFRVKIKPYKL